MKVVAPLLEMKLSLVNENNVFSWFIWLENIIPMQLHLWNHFGCVNLSLPFVQIIRLDKWSYFKSEFEHNGDA